MLNSLKRLAVLLLAATCWMPLAQGADIQGQVTQASNGAPLSGVSVSAWAESCVIGFCSVSRQAITTTDASGHYVLSNLGGGAAFAVYTESTAFANEDQAGAYCLSPRWCYAQSPHFFLSESVSGMDFALQAGATISGHAIDTVSASPWAGKWVSLSDGTSDIEVITDANGAYHFDALHPGNYAVSVINYGAGDAARLGQVYPDQDCDEVFTPCSTALSFPVAIGGVYSTADFHLHRGTFVRGHVLDAASGAAPNHAVARFVNQADTGKQVSILCGTDGSYALGPVTAGTGYVEFRADGHGTQVYNAHDCPNDVCSYASAQAVSVAANSDTTGIDATLIPFYTVSGVVTDAVTHQPIAGMRVAAGFDTLSSPPLMLNWGFNMSSDALTAADGTYSLTATSPSYPLIVRTLDVSGNWIDGAWQNVTCGYGNRFCNDPDSTPPYSLTDFSGGPHMTGVNFALGHAGAIAGQATWSPSKYAPYIRLYLLDPTSHKILKSIAAPSGGLYRLGNLEPGSYYVMIAEVQVTGIARGNLYPHGACAFNGYMTAAVDCDYSTALPVHTDAASTASGIDLLLPAAEFVFSNGFE